MKLVRQISASPFTAALGVAAIIGCGSYAGTLWLMPRLISQPGQTPPDFGDDIALLTIGALLGVGILVSYFVERNHLAREAEEQQAKNAAKLQMAEQRHIEVIARQVQEAGYHDLLERVHVENSEEALDELSDAERLFFYDTGLLTSFPGDRAGFTGIRLTDLGHEVADHLFNEQHPELFE